MNHQTAIQNALAKLELAYQDDSDPQNPVRWRVYPVRRSGAEIFIEYFGLDIALEPSSVVIWNERGLVNTPYGLFFAKPTKRFNTVLYYTDPQFQKFLKTDEDDRIQKEASACALLGTSYPARSLEKVKFAYRIKAKQTHPDSGGNAERFALVQEAYEILKAKLGGDDA